MMDHKRACIDLEKATQFILEVLQKDENAQHTNMVIYTRACIDLEKATEYIIQVLQNEVEKGVVFARSLTEQMEANKLLKLKIDELQKQLEEKDNLLTQANQGAPPSPDTKMPLVSSEAHILEVQLSRIKKEDDYSDDESDLMQGALISADSQMRLKASISGMKEEKEEERIDHRPQAAASSAAAIETELEEDEKLGPAEKKARMYARPKQATMAEQVWSTPYNPYEFISGELLDMSLLRVEEAYKDFPPEEKPLICTMGISSNVPLVECAFGMVQAGSVLSYQHPKTKNSDASRNPRWPNQ